MQFSSSAAETPTKFQSNWITPSIDAAPLRLCKILQDVLRNTEMIP